MPLLVRGPVDAATEAVETTMYRALAVLRVVVLLNAVAVNLWFWDTLTRPGIAVAVLAAMAAWTGFAIWAYDQPRLRRSPLLVADLLITVAAILATVAVKGTGFESTVPGFWAMGVVLAWAIHGHWVGGLIASSAVTLADVVGRADLDHTNYGNIFLLMIGGPVVGYTCGLLIEMAAARDRAERAAAAAGERARLARVVHDGVLQVLALVQRRGAEIGGDGAELGRLAGEQEAALRALVQTETAVLAQRERIRDLAELLRALSSRTTTVALPGGPVELPAPQAEEITAAVRACLDNVHRHVGPQAAAWVLLEELDGSVVVTVRDEGPGIPDGRLSEATAQGRLGVVESIRGRVADLGGTAHLVTVPGQGTEWELIVPRS